MERDNVDEAVKRARKELMTQKRAVSNALHGSTGFRTMDSLEQRYPCGVRLRDNTNGRSKNKPLTDPTTI
eukprot:2897094-Rhodomonas_salina.1